METSGYVDIFATKGMEYIFILGFLVALIFFWRFLHRAEEASRPGASDGPRAEPHPGRVELPENSGGSGTCREDRPGAGP